MKINTEDLHASLPDVASTMHLAGLTQPVAIYRDRWGVPHIKAANENDLFFAQGFATAQAAARRCGARTISTKAFLGRRRELWEVMIRRESLE